MNPDQLYRPNFIGGPMMCSATDLPAFENQAALSGYFDKLPAVTVDRAYVCSFCQGWHAVTHLRPPSGATSGTSTREQTGRTKP